ncbi:MAG: hypothetical protein HY584_05710 [Candidatus Omnitrophica bacterium]|nr:hypothetical protein [Candidatus Omnitrophota bacterium]
MPKVVLLFLASLLVLLVAGYFVLESNPNLKEQVLSRLFLTSIGKHWKPGPKADPEAGPSPVQENAITLYLENGNAISGELVRETESDYVIVWGGGEISFGKNEVDHVSWGELIPGQIYLDFDKEEAAKWPYQNDLVVKLTNGEIIDARIDSVSKDKVSVRQTLEGGGAIEQELDRAKIEALLFKPIENEEAKAIEARLKRLFPGMKFYAEGNMTLVTDSYVTWVKEYKRILRQAYTDFYFNFFGLLQDRKPMRQNFIVIFDDWASFVDYAVTDGVPGWAVLGYFTPIGKVLYMFNALGDNFSDLISEAIAGQAERTIDSAAQAVTDEMGDRYKVFIEGQAKSVKDKFWRAHDVIRAEFGAMTTSTLRHELTHALFNNWGLQTIVISKPTEAGEDTLLDQKKKFLEAKDVQTKRKILERLVASKKSEELPDMEAANSWLVEGLAAYCETDPCGDQNDRRLFTFQEMLKKNAVYPLEQLTVYKMGSFPGVYPEAMLHAYAQSWAFATFLMDRYPIQFMAYQKRLARETPQGNEDVQWLLEALGKSDVRALEEEFVAFMKRYPVLEDPSLEQLDQMMSIFNSF